MKEKETIKALCEMDSDLPQEDLETGVIRAIGKGVENQVISWQERCDLLSFLRNLYSSKPEEYTDFLKSL